MGSFADAQGRWLDVVVEVLTSFESSMPWEPVCQELGRQLDAPVCGEFRWGADGSTSIRAFPLPDWFDLPHVASRAPQLHPLASYYARTGVVEPLSTKQVPFSRDGAALDYLVELKQDGIDEHLWVPVSKDATQTIVVGVCRSDTPFDEDALARACIAQRVVAALYCHCEVLARWSTDVRGAAQGTAAATDLGLTPRQVAVLALVADGLTSVAIGRRLSVSARTVEHHLQNIYERLGVSDRVSAVRRGEQAGLLGPRQWPFVL